MPKKHTSDVELLKTWTLSPVATMGSSVRAKGILLELRAQLPAAVKKSLDLDGSDLVLTMAADSKTEFRAASAVVETVLTDIEKLPVIPREIQDILAIKTSERRRWLTDGRLPSAGTKTVRLNGRARAITFHVFDPKVVGDLLDRGAADEWRVEDAEAKAEKRRKAAYQAKLTRSIKNAGKMKTPATAKPDQAAPGLKGWDDFDLDGLLR